MSDTAKGNPEQTPSGSPQDPASGTEITGARAVVDALVNAGTEFVFGYPGGTIMPTYDALFEVKNRLRHVLVRHEQGAVHAAEGYARATGGVGVCMATSGPGATNLLTGMTDALMDSTPIVCITGQVPSQLLGTDAFQEADVVGMALQATKWAHQVTRAEDIPKAIARAFEVAQAGRPGPVLIDITKDAQIGTFIAPHSPTAPTSPTTGAGNACTELPDLSLLDQAAELLNGAERPLMILGQGVLLSNASAAAVEFAERLGVPTACTLLGLSAFPTDHPQYVGMVGMHGSYAANKLTNETDVLLAIGMRFDDRVTGRVKDYAPNTKIVHIDIDPAEIRKVLPTAVGIAADAKVAIDALLPKVKPRDHSAWRAMFHALDSEERQAVIDPEINPIDGALKMGEVISVLTQLTQGKALIVSDVGQHQMMAARYSHFREPLSHITSGGLGTMGFALPAAIGAKLGQPDREVICVVGDGGFQMNLQELGTIMQERLAVKIIVLNNQYLGMVRQWQKLFFAGRYSEVEMQNPDFVAICGGYGIDASTLSERAVLEHTLQGVLAHNGPYLLDVSVAREDNVFPMVAAGNAASEIQLAPA
ncbi:MAG: biosynthetic-type acetolactate synthase large subunit [Gammaproteobacteria bacterium]|nr:biosynthetic-type acetolactate synthase large subunit [Gammaproteobacteria bacterium]